MPTNPFTPPANSENLELLALYDQLNQMWPTLTDQAAQSAQTQQQPMTGAGRFLGDAAAFTPDYSYFYNPFNFVEETPQPAYMPPLFHEGWLTGQGIGLPPTTSDGLIPPGGLDPFGAPVAPPAQQPAVQPSGQWIQNQRGGMRWLDPQGGIWEDPSMQTRANPAEANWQIDPVTGTGVNQHGDPIRIQQGQVVPDQPSVANSWVMNQRGNPFWIGPSGYLWTNPQMQTQAGVNAGPDAAWRIDPLTGRGFNEFGNPIVIREGQVFPA